MTDQIEQSVRRTPVSPNDDLLEWVNREALPALRAIRDAINRRWGKRTTTAASATMDGVSGDGATEMVFCSTAGETITLPKAADRKGPVFVVNTSGGGTVTVAGNGAELVNGAASVTVSAGQGFISDGSAWWGV